MKAFIYRMSDVFDQIPKMTIYETVNLWRNAIRIVADKTKSRQHQLARNVIDAVSSEWERRRRAPLHSGEQFNWPSTIAEWGNGHLDTKGWIKEGVLSFVGYKVGNSAGESKLFREHILAELFNRQIPPLFPSSYLDQWGRPGSVDRLRKMAETIAALTRNAKRQRDTRMRTAVNDWEQDLDFLYYEYYVGKFNFAWPSAKL